SHANWRRFRTSRPTLTDSHFFSCDGSPPTWSRCSSGSPRLHHSRQMIEQGQRVGARQFERPSCTRVLLADRVIQDAEDLHQEILRLLQNGSNRNVLKRCRWLFGTV